MTAGSVERRDSPPQSVEAEQSVVGALLLDNSAWRQASELLSADDFYSYEHREIFAAVARIVAANEPADVVTVFDQLQRFEKAEACGGLAYLNALAQSVPNAANIRRYAEIVRERSVARRGLALSEELKAALSHPGDPCAVLARFSERLAQASAATQAPAFNLLTVADLQAMPPQRWRIHSVLPTHGVAAIFGPSTSGKSFLALDMTASGGVGGHWFGHKVSAGRWVYVALEGQSGFRRRVEAWEANSGRAFPDAVRFMFEPFKITNRDNVLAFAASIDAAGGADVIVVDTLNRAAPEADENSSQDMGAILEGVNELRAATGGLVVLVHHSGKDASKGMRGHSSLFAALDAAIEVTRSDDRREWKVAKSKDGEDGQGHPFRLRVVELGEDEDGEAVTSCAIALAHPGTADAAIEARVRLPKGGNQKIVYDALGPLLRASSTFGRAGAPATRPCIEIEAAIAGTRDRLTVEPKRRGERARAAITGLVASGVAVSNEGWLWLA